MTQQILSYFQIGVAVLLGTAILLQQKGQGLSGAFGGEGGFYRTKRGLEKTLLIATVVLAVLFVGTGIFRITFLGNFVENTLPTPPITTDMPALQLGTEPAAEVPISIPQVEFNTEPVSPKTNQ